VKRLRELNTFEWHARPATTKEVCLEAANRIEKLEAALREIAAPDWDSESYPDEIARKALENKDD
jgi:hypothetical protein